MDKSSSVKIGRRGFLGLAAALPLALSAAPAAAAPVSRLWERWLPHEPEARYGVDHQAWDAFLARYLVVVPGGVNRFNYGGVTVEDRGRLDRYLGGLGQVLISQYNRDEQFAFWLNLYNALVVQVVLEHYPVASIREIDIGGSIFGAGPWSAKLVEVEEERLSLDDIEHRILRPIWKDPRLHYVINCAALGCPQLPARAMTSRNCEEMLEEAARAFINHPRGVTPLRGGLPRGLLVSRIYDWYLSDFGGYEGALIKHLLRYAEPALAREIAATPYVSEYAYDWALNDSNPVSG